MPGFGLRHMCGQKLRVATLRDDMFYSWLPKFSQKTPKRLDLGISSVGFCEQCNAMRARAIFLEDFTILRFVILAFTVLCTTFWSDCNVSINIFNMTFCLVSVVWWVLIWYVESLKAQFKGNEDGLDSLVVTTCLIRCLKSQSKL